MFLWTVFISNWHICSEFPVFRDSGHLSNRMTSQPFFLLCLHNCLQREQDTATSLFARMDIVVGVSINRSRSFSQRETSCFLNLEMIFIYMNF